MRGVEPEAGAGLVMDTPTTTTSSSGPAYRCASAIEPSLPWLGGMVRWAEQLFPDCAIIKRLQISYL